MVPKNEITDLFDSTLSEEISVNAWRNNELTFRARGDISVGFEVAYPSCF